MWDDGRVWRRLSEDMVVIPVNVVAKRFQSILSFTQRILNEYPERRARHSQQVWLGFDSGLTQKVLTRAQRLTGLPAGVVNSSEKLLVVNYPPSGRYLCHWDETVGDVKSGDFRLATLGIMLHPASLGGETAFPAAGKRAENRFWREKHWLDFEMKCSQKDQCTNMGGLVVKAKKGDAIFWYNVKPEAWGAKERPVSVGEGMSHETTWNLMMKDSIHCGAEVKQGEKWWANLWLHPRNNQLEESPGQ